MTLDPSRRGVILVLAIYLILSALPCAAENPLIPTASLSASVGADVGQVRELVYAVDRIFSELDWDMKPLWGAEIGARLDWESGLLAEGDFSVGLPGLTGIMEDSDYLNIDRNGSGAKTHFSRHNANVGYSYSWSARFGWKLPLPVRGPKSRSVISVTPLLGFRYWTTRWTSSDGYLQHPDWVYFPTDTDADGTIVYKEWTENTEKKSVLGIPITYLGEYWTPTIGAKALIPIGEAITIEPEFDFSVFVGWNGLDRHYRPALNTADYSASTDWANYYDVLSNGFLIAPSLRASYAMNERLLFFASARWTYIDRLRGDTYYKKTSTSPILKSPAAAGSGGGAAMSALTFRAGVTVRL
ncbi:MAG TPA: omptin family outer membrane protease [Treponemataceae bacterium]|nr:omptin family outer membrane protease [Treponemataceae bacterium]